MRAGDVPAPVRDASTTFRPAVLGSVAPALGGVSGLESQSSRVAFGSPTHRGVQFRFAPLTAGHGCAGNRCTGLVAPSSTAFRSTLTLSATGWARCAGRGSGSHCARPLRLATAGRVRVVRPRPWNRCAGKSCFDSVRVLAVHSGPTRRGTPLHSGSNRLRLTLHGDSRASSYGGARLNMLFRSLPASALFEVRLPDARQSAPTSPPLIRTAGIHARILLARSKNKV